MFDQAQEFGHVWKHWNLLDIAVLLLLLEMCKKLYKEYYYICLKYMGKYS